MFTCASQSETKKKQVLKGMRLILVLVSVFSMVACSETIDTPTPSESDVTNHDTVRKIIETASDAGEVALILDESLNRAYEYFSHIKDCDDEPDLENKDRCLSQIKSIYGDLWGDNPLARNRFSGNIKFTDPLVPTYASSTFKWRLTLHGLLDEFVINHTSYFPSYIDDELVTLYLEHLENNDVIKRLPVRAEGESRYKAQSLDSLRLNFPEFKLSEYMPKNYRAGPVLSGHEFTMFFGEENSEVHEMWSTNFSASHCRRAESFFYKIKIGYESAWLREYMEGRNVATIHVCALDISGPPRVTVFKLE